MWTVFGRSRSLQFLLKDLINVWYAYKFINPIFTAINVLVAIGYRHILPFIQNLSI
jgi:hypothetical protein